MAWAATSTPGTIYKINVGGTLKQIEGVQSATGPSGSKTTTERTALSDTSRKYIGGRATTGKVSYEMAFDPTDPSQLKFITAFAAVPAVDIAFENAHTDQGLAAYSYSGLVDELGLNFPNEGLVVLRAGVSIKTALTDGAPTSITPNASFAPIVGQGTTLGFWDGAAYDIIPGVSNVEISGASRTLIPATQQSALTSSYLVGMPASGKISFDLFWDSTDATHLALYAAFQAANQQDRFQITMTDASTATITLNPCVVDGWDFQMGSRDAPNLVRVSAQINTTIVVVP